MHRRAILAAALVLAACHSTSTQVLTAESDATISRFIEQDAGMRSWFETAYGYAVFPSVGKGGVGLGGAYGEGLVYEEGRVIGRTTLTQATIGLQLGGQSYSEVIFLRTKGALDDFKRGNYELGAQASAVAATAGASTDADYAGDVAIFTLPKGGLMYEASVGGQKFDFTPGG